MPNTLHQQFDEQQLANGYELVDGVAMHAENGERFQIPHPVLKKHVGVGHFVELRIDSPRFSVHDDAAEKCRCEGYRSAWEVIEAESPEMWSEFKSTDVEAMIDELVVYKKKHFPDDLRRILLCGIPNGSIRVEWLPPARPEVDSKWEMQLYALVRTDEREQAISFLRKTRRLSRTDAVKQMKKIASDLGLG